MMTAECQQPITMVANHQSSNLQQYQHHQQQQHHHHQHQLMQHQHQYNQDNQQQQMIVSSQFQNHNVALQQQQVRHVHSIQQSRCSPVQVYAGGQVSMAPPTPPSDEVPTYQLVAVQRQAWSATSSIGSEHALISLNHHQQITNANANANASTNANTNTNTNNGGYYQQPSQPTTTIANYYYDIDDEFSDILSAPPTPEPMMLGVGHHNHHHHHHHHNHHNHHHQHNHQQHQSHHSHHIQQQQQQPSSYPQQDHQQHQQEEQGYHQTTDYRNYLPYSQPMSVASGCGGPSTYELGSHYAMSPDSSSLSTTSSSPSDHSLYQSTASLGQPISQPPSVGGQQQQQLVQQQHPIQVKQEHQEVSQPQQAQVRVQPQAPGLVVAATTQVQQQQHHHRSSPIHLWEFLKELLQQVETSEAEGVIRWVDRAKGVFKIEDSVRVAKLWGKRKNKPKMNYDKLSRSIRQYYKKGIMKKTDRSQRLVYQFCSAYCH